MTGTEYQELAARTLIAKPDFSVSDADVMLAWNALGLVGEAGEVADTIKKQVFHQHGIDADKIQKELGDVMWYVAAIATKLGLDLSTIMERNIEKLRLRYPSGYSPEDSKRRLDIADHGAVSELHPGSDS
jgi:NTP pyrophosphatase (non-canonical NTP hydrolase)